MGNRVFKQSYFEGVITLLIWVPFHPIHNVLVFVEVNLGGKISDAQPRVSPGIAFKDPKPLDFAGTTRGAPKVWKG